MTQQQVKLWAVYLAYFGIMLVLQWEWGWSSLWWLVGGFLGMGFVFIDRIMYVFLTNPHEHLSEHVRHLMREGRYIDGLKLLKARGHEQRKLTVRSVFFMGAWIPAALFMVTSTASSLAMGLIMGIGLHILVDVWQDWRDMTRLKSWMFWPIKRQVSDGEVKAVVAVFGVFFLGMTLALI